MSCCGLCVAGQMIGFDRGSQDKQLGNQSNCVGLERVGWQRSSGGRGDVFCDEDTGDSN